MLYFYYAKYSAPSITDLVLVYELSGPSLHLKTHEMLKLYSLFES